MDLRTSLAVLTARVLSLAGKIAGRQGVTLGGKAALKINPTILRKLSSQVKGDIIVTCGTNGKTTTNNLIASAYEAEGKKVIRYPLNGTWIDIGNPQEYQKAQDLVKHLYL